MTPTDDVTKEQEIADTTMKRPHVVILGAGASRAACPTGDKNGTLLPLMEDFVNIVGLRSLLSEWGISPEENFENIFSGLYESGDHEKVAILKREVEHFFARFELPARPTIYDHLLLSLRGKDLVATFNWDPLLLQAYLRNKKAGLQMPKLAFLHGNVGIGYCEKDRVTGLANELCPSCSEPYTSSELLYPIKQKDYASNGFLVNEWNRLRHAFHNAFMITIFGYGGPKTDQEAIQIMKEAWGNVTDRALEQTEFIDLKSEDEICEIWSAFIHSHHYDVHQDFYASWIANHPRRSIEACVNQYFYNRWIQDNPIPRGADFPELWEWFKPFKAAEKLQTGSEGRVKS